MELRIDEKQVEKSMNEVVSEAIASALRGYEIEKAIRDQVASVVAHEVLAESISDGISKIDIAGMGSALAKELQRTTIAASVSIIKTYTAELMVKLTNGESYGRDKEQLIRKAMRKIEDEKEAQKEK